MEFFIAHLDLENYEESKKTSSSPQQQFTYLQLCPNTINKQAKYLCLIEMFYKVEKKWIVKFALRWKMSYETAREETIAM